MSKEYKRIEILKFIEGQRLVEDSYKEIFGTIPLEASRLKLCRRHAFRRTILQGDRLRIAKTQTGSRILSDTLIPDDSYSYAFTVHFGVFTWSS